MKSFRTSKFKQLFAELPREIQDAARKAYYRWLVDPWHPSLHFRSIRADIWSVRISSDYRAIGVLRNCWETRPIGRERNHVHNRGDDSILWRARLGFFGPWSAKSVRNNSSEPNSLAKRRRSSRRNRSAVIGRLASQKTNAE